MLYPNGYRVYTAKINHPAITKYQWDHYFSSGVMQAKKGNSLLLHTTNPGKSQAFSAGIQKAKKEMKLIELLTGDKL